MFKCFLLYSWKLDCVTASFLTSASIESRDFACRKTKGSFVPPRTKHEFICSDAHQINRTGCLSCTTSCCTWKTPCRSGTWFATTGSSRVYNCTFKTTFAPTHIQKTLKLCTKKVHFWRKIKYLCQNCCPSLLAVSWVTLFAFARFKFLETASVRFVMFLSCYDIIFDTRSIIHCFSVPTIWVLILEVSNISNHMILNESSCSIRVETHDTFFYHTFRHVSNQIMLKVWHSTCSPILKV